MITITESNCNFHLTRLYKQRDRISTNIDRVIVAGGDPINLEKQHDNICDEIDAFLKFRRNHKCLLEGDPGYGPL